MSNVQWHDIIFPRGYKWIIQQGWVGYAECTGLQPWYFLEERKQFVVTEKWANGSFPGTLIAFARRQDNDEIACFVIEALTATQIVIVNGWTSSGYDVLHTYSSFWEWMKSVIDDIAAWVDTC